MLEIDKLFVYAWQRTKYGVDGQTQQSFEILKHGFRSMDDDTLFVNVRLKFGNREIEGSVKIVNDINHWKLWNSPYKTNVILIVTQNEKEMFLSYDFKSIATTKLDIGREFVNVYNELLYNGKIICGEVMRGLNDFDKEHITTQLTIERLNDKCDRIANLHKETNENWSDTCLASLFDAVMISNKSIREAYSQLIRKIGYNSIIINLVSGDYEEDILNVEALLFGTAGLLGSKFTNYDDYIYSLRQRFDIIQKRYSIVPMSYGSWASFNARNITFDIQLAQLAALIVSVPTLHHSLMAITRVEDIFSLFKVKISPYWLKHSSLGVENSSKMETIFTKSKVELIIINFVVPYLFYHNVTSDVGYDDTKCEKLLDLLANTSGERHSLVNPWLPYIDGNTAFRTQALTQLSKIYCKYKNCFKCRIGRKYLNNFPLK